MSAELVDEWPRACFCNMCGHVKTFESWDALEGDPVCERCGEHALQGSGYCWCDSCNGLAVAAQPVPTG